MNQTLFVVYSNLGIGGMPKRLVDILNGMGTSHPKTKIYVLLKKRRAFDLRSTITNPNVIIKDFCRRCPGNNSVLFILWVWALILVRNPGTILSFISPYALPVLATKLIYFWRDTTVIINEGHYTSTMISSMACPTIQRLGIRLLYPIADAVIVPTKAIRADLHVSFHVPTGKVRIVPNWTTYARAPIRKTNRIYDVVYVGRIEKEKNIIGVLGVLYTLIKKRRLRLSCLLVGEGSDLKRCEGYISSHRLNSDISIRPPTTRIISCLERAKIFVFNPDKTTEGFPVAMLDAMACGAIVVTKEFAGVREVINNTNGYVVTSREEMAKQIETVLRHYGAQRRLIRLAKQRVAQYNSPANILQYTQLFSR